MDRFLGRRQARDLAGLRYRRYSPGIAKTPASAWHDPLIEGAPRARPKGHNSGVPLNIIAAIAGEKRVMEREHLKGTIRLWPGVAEELVGTQGLFSCAPAMFQGRRHLPCSRTSQNNMARLVGDRAGQERSCNPSNICSKAKSAHAAGRTLGEAVARSMPSN